MARYYGVIQGNRGEATRMGSAKSGFWGHIRGWRVGAKVECRTDPKDADRDWVQVAVTHGSNGYGSDLHVADFKETKDGVEVVLYHPRTRNVVARHTLEG